MKKTKIIAILTVFTSLLVLTGIVVAAGVIWASDISRVNTHTFAPGENVYASGAELPDMQGDLYVTENRAWSGGEDINAEATVILKRNNVPDEDLEATPPVLLGKVSNDGTLYDIPYPGKYDVLWDADNDGYFDADEPIDYIECEGFETIPEFATIAIPAVAILGLFLFFNHRKHKEK